MYSQYNRKYSDEIRSCIEKTLLEKINAIRVQKSVYEYREFWWILIFNKCPFITNASQNAIDNAIKEAIVAAFPKTEYQRCIVHQVRNTLKYVPDKDRKAFASDLKTIYHASDEEKARLALDRVTEKWTAKYPNFMKRWYDNWDAITPIFKFSPDVRKVIYTTNAIESLNSTYRKLNRQRSVFPSDTALLKVLYLATFEATKKWTMSIRNWGQVYGELSIMYEGRLPE